MGFWWGSGGNVIEVRYYYGGAFGYIVTVLRDYYGSMVGMFGSTNVGVLMWWGCLLCSGVW